jgi:hypothetical protein
MLMHWQNHQLIKLFSDFFPHFFWKSSKQKLSTNNNLLKNVFLCVLAHRKPHHDSLFVWRIKKKCLCTKLPWKWLRQIHKFNFNQMTIMLNDHRANRQGIRRKNCPIRKESSSSPILNDDRRISWKFVPFLCTQLKHDINFMLGSIWIWSSPFNIVSEKITVDWWILMYLVATHLSASKQPMPVDGNGNEHLIRHQIRFSNNLMDFKFP